MDKHYGWQEGRGAQGQGRPQNGQRWNERYRDDRDMRTERGGESGGGWDQQDDRRWTSSGADLDREDYLNEGEEYGGQSRGGFGSRGQSRWSQQGGASSRGREFGGGSQGFSGGHYGGFANEGYPGRGNYGGNRGFSNPGYSGQRFNQGGSGRNWGQTFGQGYAGGEYGDQGFGDQGYGNQGYGNQGFGNQGYGNQRFGNQGWRGQNFGQGSGGASYGGQSYGGSYQGRGHAGRGPKGYQRSDERVKEQLSDRLMDDDDIDASEITVEVKNGEVTLTGTVGSREEKRAAEEIAEQSPGVREVQNHLRVSQEASSGQFSLSGRSGQSAQSGQSSQPSSTSATSGQSKSRTTERE
jgi:hypothetical protein